MRGKSLASTAQSSNSAPRLPVKPSERACTGYLSAHFEVATLSCRTHLSCRLQTARMSIAASMVRISGSSEGGQAEDTPKGDQPTGGEAGSQEVEDPCQIDEAVRDALEQHRQRTYGMERFRPSPLTFPGASIGLWRRWRASPLLCCAVLRFEEDVENFVRGEESQFMFDTALTAYQANGCPVPCRILCQSRPCLAQQTIGFNAYSHYLTRCVRVGHAAASPSAPSFAILWLGNLNSGGGREAGPHSGQEDSQHEAAASEWSLALSAACRQA